jgi:hypothetical protein
MMARVLQKFYFSKLGGIHPLFVRFLEGSHKALPYTFNIYEYVFPKNFCASFSKNT